MTLSPILAGHDGLRAELSARRAALQELASILSSCKSSTSIGLSPSGDRVDCYPFTLLTLRIETTSSPQLQASITGHDLLLRGDSGALSWLADTIADFAAGRLGKASHIHIEHYEGHPRIDTGSAPLVIAAIDD